MDDVNERQTCGVRIVENEDHRTGIVHVFATMEFFGLMEVILVTRPILKSNRV